MGDRWSRSEAAGGRIPAIVEDDEPGWMDTFTDLDEDVVDAVLSGRPSASSPALVQVVAALRRRRAAEPVPPMAAGLRAQVEEGRVVALAARRSARRALVLAAAAAAAVVAFGVGAAQNRLPAGIQDVVSSTVGQVGVHVETSDERGQGHEHRSDVADTRAQDDADRTPGHDGPTPGGATPASPNGAGQPATPAVPAEGGGTDRTDRGRVADAHPDEVEGTVAEPAPDDADVQEDQDEPVDEASTTTVTHAPRGGGKGADNGGGKGGGSAQKAGAE